MTQMPASTSPLPYAWSTNQDNESPGGFSCDESCRAHSDVVHDAAKLLQAYHTIPGRFLSGHWNPDNTIWASAVSENVATDPGGTFWPLPISTQGYVQAPAPQSMQTADLMRVYVKLICQYKASLDANPDASNPYIKYYVPYSVQSPLLANVSVYTAAGFLNQTGHIDQTVAMASKCHAIGLLNDHLGSKSLPSDEGIAGVVQLIVNEWYWGDTNDLRAHMRGLREMIKLRGGFGHIALHGLISKLAITSDVAIALSFEIPPFLQGGSEFEFHEATQVPLRLALNTPLVSSLAPFKTCDEALRIHPATASILDDMRFLITTVLTLPEAASAKELQKVHTTSAWIYDRILKLRPDGPGPRPPTDLSPTSSSATSFSFGNAGGSRANSEVSDDQTMPRLAQPQPRRGQGLGVEQPQQQQQGGRRRSVQLSPGGESPRTAERSSPGASDGSDYIYQAVRLAALMYSRAVSMRRPFSQVNSVEDFLELWTTAWRVPLVSWRALLGVFNWLLLPLISSGRNTPHDLYVKSMMNISLLQMGMDNWDIARRTMDGALRLQWWLCVENRKIGATPEAGGSGEGSSGRPRGGGAGEEEEEDENEDGQGGHSGKQDKGKGKAIQRVGD